MITNLIPFESNADLEKAKLHWLTRLRWGAIGLFFVLAIPAYFFKFIDSTTLPIYVGLIGFLFLFNWLTQFAFSQSVKKITPFFIGFQLALDLFILFSLLLISKGIENPFVCLFLYNAALGGVLIRGNYSVPFVFLCHTLLLALQIQHVSNHSAEVTLETSALMVVAHALIFLAWFMMRSLGSYLENHFENLSQFRLRAEKQDRLRALGALAAGFSHEFASPLNAAKLHLDRLQRGIKDQRALTELLENITEAQLDIATCENVIHQMNSSQLDVREFNLKNIPLNSLIQDVVESWKEEHPEANLKVNLLNEIFIKVPPINFAQVLLNLLDNAFEAANKKTIQLFFKVENAQAHLIVEDDGPGFSQLVLQRQGEPFITTKEEGTGLGLYVSNLFAQSMGGQLSINNKSTQGARVSIIWPTETL